MPTDLIADLAREQVAQIAPDELPLFRTTSEAYFSNPDATLTGRKGGDDMLGFGAPEALSFLTPVVLAVATDVVQFLVAEVGKSLKTEGAGVIEQTVRNLFKSFRRSGPGPAPGAPPVPLTVQQLEGVRQIALDKARALKLPEAEAVLLADAMVGGLLAA